MVEDGEPVSVHGGVYDERSRLDEVQLEARLVFDIVRSADTDDRHLLEAGVHDRLADQRRVVGGAALSQLGDGHGHLVQVILARLQRLDQVAHDQGGWVADLVVGVFQSHIIRIRIAQRQGFHVVASPFEGGREEWGEVFREEWREDLPALVVAHLEASWLDEWLHLGGFLGLELEALDEGAHAEFHGTHVVDIVYLQ